ncbi:hypothetical protein HDV00_002659 [Rhizophlyctis rosea]|nr:hypothetical protein HDV00_002659 [Rhizophlyctis rosea]
MAVVLLSVLSWLYSLLALVHLILCPIFLFVIAGRPAFRLIIATFVLHLLTLPPLLYIWYQNDKDDNHPIRRRRSVSTFSLSPTPDNDDDDETEPLIARVSPEPVDVGGGVKPERVVRRRPTSGSLRSSEERDEVPGLPGEEGERGVRRQRSKESVKGGEALVTFIRFLLDRKVRSFLITVLTLANLILFSIVMDYVYRPFLFHKHHSLTISRVGSITPDTVRMFIRSPSATALRFEYASEGEEEGRWRSGPEVNVTRENDWTASVKCQGLEADTRYRYRWVESESGESVFGEDEEKEFGFRTAPVEGKPTKFTFVFTSCVKPNFPYGTKDIKGFREIRKQENLAFVLFLGDLIYADSPTVYGTDVDTYRWHYRWLYAQPDFRNLFRQTPLLTIYDDHEVLNNWHSHERDPFPAAFRAFNDYAGLTNPHDDANLTAVYEYWYGDSAFFVMDTREFRDLKGKTMLGEAQKGRVKEWLVRVNSTSTFKFLVSSVPFTQNWQWDGFDTWGGYMAERQEILDFISDNRIQNVIVLSGDRHEVGVTRLPGGVVEFSTRPFDTYVATGQDEKIFTWRPGHTKWATFTVDTTGAGGEVPKATYRLYVNDYSDAPVYSYKYVAKV